MKGVAYFLFKSFVWMVGKLSDRSLYRGSTFLKIILLDIIGYRKAVVLQNLKNSFPEKSKADIKSLMHQYYQNLSDLIFETLASYNWPAEKLKERFQFVGVEVLQEFILQNQRVLAVAAHTGNFEIGAVLVHQQLSVTGYSMYRPLANPKLDKTIYDYRSRFGLTIVASKDLRKMIDQMSFPSCLFLIADQNPSKIEKAYWVNFLHQDTAFAHGPAEIAKAYQMPMVYLNTHRVKRGYYQSEVVLLFKTVEDKSHQQITEAIASKLEQTIQEHPDDWLWSHKRWKWKRDGQAIVRL